MKATFVDRIVNTVNMTMEVTADEFEAAINKVYNKNRSYFTVPGFRKGKATRKMIETHYGKDIFIQDAVTEVFNENYPKALEELGIDPEDHPEIDTEGQEIKSGNGITFKISFITAPEVTIENYKGVKIELPTTEVTDAEVDAQIQSYANRNARLVTVERAAEENDTVVFDYKGFTDDGEQFEGGTAENAKLKLGSGQFIPGFEDQLIGSKAGDEVTVDVVFPENYPSEKLAGQHAKFECVIHDVKEEDVPPVDDDLAAECSEFDTLEEWKADVKRDLEEKKQNRLETQKENEVIRSLFESTTIDIPEVMIEHGIDDLLQQFDQQLSYSGINLQQYLKQTGTELSDMREQVRAEAERKVKTRLIVEAVAKQEGCEATEEDLEAELKRMGVQYGVDAAKMRELVGADIAYIKKDIASKKAAKIMGEAAVVEWFTPGADDAEEK